MRPCMVLLQFVEIFMVIILKMVLSSFNSMLLHRIKAVENHFQNNIVSGAR